MRKDFGAKPFTYPQPVLILGSYDKDGNPDAMNAAWGGISGGNEISMCISAGHKSTKNIIERKAFTVSWPTSNTLPPATMSVLSPQGIRPINLKRRDSTPSNRSLLTRR